jgi:hypothetical protein
MRRRDILEQIRNDAEFLAAHRIDKAELDFLNQVQMFGNLNSVDDVLLILRNIRGEKHTAQQ